jgi:hypothetical protein
VEQDLLVYGQARIVMKGGFWRPDQPDATAGLWRDEGRSSEMDLGSDVRLLPARIAVAAWWLVLAV